MEKRAIKDRHPARSKIILSLVVVASLISLAVVNTTIEDFFLPGSQPGQSGNIESPDKCDNCHGGYDQAVEPAFNWRGSMMAQAARDPLFYACLAIANQDAPESGDLCIRCHAPDGWLGGRSVPTDGSALNNNDREGVQCDFCHKLIKPAPLRVNPYPDDPDYLVSTFTSEQDYLATLSDIPPTSANGMYVAHSDNTKRGPFSDAEARHQQAYSPFHKEAALCGTCHDVSNPAFSRSEALDEFGNPIYVPNDFGAKAPDFNNSSLFPIERTYSEWLVSDFNSTEGIAVPGFGGNKPTVATCQDCHMRDVSGFGCNKKGVPFRDDLPLHDMTGGNTFIPGLVAQLYPGEVNVAALDAGVQRATEMLQKAATFEVTTTDIGTGYEVVVKVTNNTGHKLPSGYPEGRRIWINVEAYDIDDNMVYSNGSYDFGIAEIKSSTDNINPKIYEIKPGIGENLTTAVPYPAGPSFHFVLNNQIFKDNRIPPIGTSMAELASIQSPVIGATYEENQNWDVTTYQVEGSDITRIEARLFYQTLSKEYVTFLRDENVTNDAGDLLYNLWESNGKSAPEVMAEKIIYPNGGPPTLSMLASILSVSRIVGKGNKEYAFAEVHVLDNNGNPLAGAVVNTNYDGPTSGSTTATTDGSGIAILESRSIRGATGTWCFEVAGVTLDGYEYDNSAVRTCETLAGGRISANTDILSQDLAINFTLYQNYPNPFTGQTNIKFDVPVDSHVSLQVYDTQGRMVKSLVSTKLTRGRYNYTWDATDVADGQYILKLLANDVIESKMLLKVN